MVADHTGDDLYREIFVLEFDTAIHIQLQETTVNRLDLSESSQLCIYPNPAHHTLYVALPDYLTSGKVEIVNILGRVFLSQRINSSLVEMDVSGLHEGMYVLKAIKAGQCYIRKSIIRKE